MKKILFFLVLSFAAMGQEQMTFVLTSNTDKNDTLHIHSNPEEIQYYFIYNGDTLASESTFSTLSNSFSSLGVFGFTNTFLLSTYCGDGCPVLYRILVFKEDGTWFVSEQFGNCNWFSDFRVKGGRFLEWTFPAMVEAKRKKVKVVYDAELFILK